MLKLNHKIPIDILDFIKTGKFDYLKLGMSKEKVSQIFPLYDAVGVKDNIWRYGNFELHFTDNVLTLIFNDYLSTMDGGKHLEVNTWIFGNGQGYSLKEIMALLVQEQIPFHFTYVTSDFTTVKIIIHPSKVELYFSTTHVEIEEGTNPIWNWEDYWIHALSLG